MKKALAGIMAAVLVASAGSTGVQAAAGNGNRKSNKTNTTTVCRFVDKNNDGICDNSSKGCNYTDKNGDGICDNHSRNSSNSSKSNNSSRKNCGNAQGKGRGCRR